MKPYEVNLLLQNIEYSDKSSWEQTRMQMYITAQVNSSKKLKPTDILSLPWDNENNNKVTKISNEDKQRLRKKSELLRKKLLQQT